MDLGRAENGGGGYIVAEPMNKVLLLFLFLGRAA